jgi:hypothetical protein
LEAEDAAPYELGDDERSDLLSAIDEVARGDVASGAEVEAFFARFRAG